MLISYANRGSRQYGDGPTGGTARIGWEMQCILHGTCWPQLGSRKLGLGKAPVLWLFPKGSSHYWYDTTGSSSEILVIHTFMVPSVLERFMNQRDSWCRRLSSHQLTKTIEHFRSIEKEFRDQRGLSELRISQSIHELAYILLEKAPLAATSSPVEEKERIVSQAMEWFSQQMADGPTLNDVARAMKITPTHLRRLFREVRGRNPKDCFRELRLGLARQLICETPLSLEDISNRTGYSELSSFSRAYRHHHGHAPSRDRR